MNFGFAALILASTSFAACQLAHTKPRANLFKLQEPQPPIPRTTTAERKEIHQLMAREMEEKTKQQRQEELLLVEMAAKEKALQLELQAQQARILADKISEEVKVLMSQNRIHLVSQQKTTPSTRNAQIHNRVATLSHLCRNHTF